jgi:hypothetical protein
VNRSIYKKLAILIASSSVLVFTFNNCGENFQMLTDGIIEAHEASTMSNDVYINGATENQFYSGKDLVFQADLTTAVPNSSFDWQYTLNGVSQGCNRITTPVPSTYKINCPTTTGELVVKLVVRSGGVEIPADDIKYILAPDPGVVVATQMDVPFSIVAGTGNKPWNTADNPIRAKIGQRIMITNNDTVVHRMHTGGKPCPHGANIQPGQTAACVVNSVFLGNNYDHNLGTAAKVFFDTSAQ